MKDGWIRGLFTGAVVGAGAAMFAGMMNRQTKRRMAKIVCGSAQKLADKTDEMFK